MNTKQKIKRERFEQLLAECRQMWNEFDPIGVYHDGEWPRDEYDSYARQSVGLVQSRADLYRLEAFVRSVVHVSIGLSDVPDEAIAAFAEKLRELEI